MILKSVPLARAFCYLSLDELTLGTNVFLPNLVESLVKRCQFQKSPNSPKEFDLKEGVVFEQGVFNGIVIRKFTVFALVMHLDAGSSTDESRAALDGILQWAKEEFGLRYYPGMIRRWAYVSDIIFETDFPLLLAINPTLNSISEAISAVIRKNLGEELTYAPAKLWLAHDPNERSAPLAAFTLEHRALSLPEENVYYSEAPIPTNEHIALLGRLEESLRKSCQPR